MRVTRYTNDTGEEETVRVETGFAYRLALSLDGTDGPDDVCTTVVAILDGHAAEIAEVAADGTWLNTACTVDRPDGGRQRRTQIAPAWRLKGAPVDHEHRRKIDPWPAPRDR